MVIYALVYIDQFQYLQTMTDTRRAVWRDTYAIHLTPIVHILPVSISSGRLAHLNPEIAKRPSCMNVIQARID